MTAVDVGRRSVLFGDPIYLVMPFLRCSDLLALLLPSLNVSAVAAPPHLNLDGK